MILLLRALARVVAVLLPAALALAGLAVAIASVGSGDGFSLPWLAELMPEMFVEISEELARELGITNTEWVVVESPRGKIEVKALVTGRLKPLKMGNLIQHQVGMPIHWGYEGLVKGASANDLAAIVAEPNVTIHEGKAFVCNIRKL